MAVQEFVFSDSGLAQTVTRLLDGLKRSTDDDDLYSVIYSGLRRYGRQGAINGECVAFIHDQLSRITKDPVSLPRTRIKARLVQQHLSLYLPTVPTAREAGATPTITPTAILDRPVTAAASAPVAANNLAARRTNYETLHRSEQDAWKAIYQTINDFTRLKELWVSNLDDMARNRDALSQQVTAATERLQTVETETQVMRGELEKLRLTAAKRPVIRALPRSIARLAKRTLPRREQFLRSLEGEVERVHRQPGPLALALLDIDGLAQIRAARGGDAAETVQGAYVEEILASFRAYDIVSFYDGDTIAVIFPNTTREGAVRALEKARKRASASHYASDGERHLLPGFSAGLAIHVAGENVEVLLARASHASESARAEGAATPLVVV